MVFHVITALAILSTVPAQGQLLMKGINTGEPLRLFPSDAAILESHEARTDLPCVVKPVVPKLGFDFRFHSGYEVTVPLQELAGNGNGLTAIFRVIPEDQPGEPEYFSQKWTVPPIGQDAKGKADLHGAFVLGEGRYQIEWLLRDHAERFCSSRWQIVVDPRGRDRQVQLSVARGSVAAEDPDLFRKEAPMKREGGQLLDVLVLFHVAPQADRAAALRDGEMQALLAILRRIVQEPRIGSYSIVAFNLDQSSVLYQLDNTAQIDFPALGEALKQLHLGTIDIQKLREKDNETHFLSTLVAGEMTKHRPDALIFVGTRTALGSAALNHSLKELGEPQFPVFYLNYNSDPVTNPWRDLIGSLVKLWRGTEYTISKPADLFTLWPEVMARISNKRPTTSVPMAVPSISGLVPEK